MLSMTHTTHTTTNTNTNTDTHVIYHVRTTTTNDNNNKAVYPKSALVCVTCCGMDLSEQPVAGAAQRRRQRRLHSWLRHERMTVAMALAESTHHSSRGQKTARTGVWERKMNYTATIRDPPHPSRSSSACTKSPAARGLTGSRRSGRRTGICGAQWTRSSIPCRGYRLSTFLCRRWWTVGVARGLRRPRSRAGYRSAHVVDAHPLPSHGSLRAADSGKLETKN